ncbi:MAG: hypothetical protein IJE43_07355 [Alphaproteobacteria bacterium]|nr:hypothetical protein [Alphaproteobacteria bacterium]
MIHKWAVILGAILGICGCARDDIDNRSFAYQIQGINAYRGQDVSSLFDANGAPNAVKRLGNDQVMWVYYTNYRPVGGGEMISYDNPPMGKTGTSCMVRVVLEDDVVQQVFTNCS